MAAAIDDYSAEPDGIPQLPEQICRSSCGCEFSLQKEINQSYKTIPDYNCHCTCLLIIHDFISKFFNIIN